MVAFPNSACNSAGVAGSLLTDNHSEHIQIVDLSEEVLELLSDSGSTVHIARGQKALLLC